MSQPTETWADEVKETVARRAYTLNYEDGVQCRVLPFRKDEGWHISEICLEMTHAGHPFDLTWFVRWTDDPADAIHFDLVAPPAEGGTLWSEGFVGVPRFAAAAEVIPVFIRGYFVGRESVAPQPAKGA
jgi:hypothetical protein